MAGLEKVQSVSASEFTRNFGHYRSEAFADGLVKVTSHGRVIGAFLSARELAEYQAMKQRRPEVLRSDDLSDDVIASIEAAEYDKTP